METFALLCLLGIAVGALGTLIGAGGGFVLMPVLILMYPRMTPEATTAVSLAVVFFNAASGSIAYARMRRIDYKAGLLFAGFALPGAVLGAVTTYWLSKTWFEIIFGSLLGALSVFLLIRPRPKPPSHEHGRRNTTTHTIREGSGATHVYSFNPRIGSAISIVVGYVSSLLGLGGGIVHVPAMTYLLNFPIHVATATSHFMLAIMALAGTTVHLAEGTLQQEVWMVIPLAVGAVVGAQGGAWASGRVKGLWIIRGLAAALALVALRILLKFP